MKKKLLCFPLLLILALLSACGDEPERVQIIAMDTVMTFQTYGKAAEDALVDASAEVRRLDALLSRTDPESAVSRVNSAGGAPVEAGAELSELLETAAEYSRMSGGAFDITLAPVSSAWGFTTDSYRVPSRAELDALLAHVGMEHVHVSGDTVTLDGGTQIDLGAIAKGYAADRVLDLYREAGLERGWAALGQCGGAGLPSRRGALGDRHPGSQPARRRQCLRGPFVSGGRLRRDLRQLSAVF